MLIRYTVENFLSFHERNTFSMISGRGTLKSFHKTNKLNGVSVLKAGVVFGANASGKSNLIKALDFGRRFILNGGLGNDDIWEIPIFRLDPEAAHRNVYMEYEIRYKGKNYAYGFEFNGMGVVREWLYEISKSGQKLLFERDETTDARFDLSALYKKNPVEEQMRFLEFVAMATPGKRLFLTEIVSRRVKENVQDISDLLAVYDWFLHVLRVIFPESRYDAGLFSGLVDNKDLQHVYEKMLNYFDTGISGICLKSLNDQEFRIPDVIMNEIKEVFSQEGSENRIITLMNASTQERYLLNKDSGTGKLRIQKFMTKHHSLQPGQVDVYFEPREESDGTNRIIDYIPLLLDLLKGGKVFIVDEMERSLHPNLMYNIFELYLRLIEDKESQLVVSTHESVLLTQKLFRKDEIWFVNKENGTSKMYPLESFPDQRFDKKIEIAYKEGTYKAKPNFKDIYPLLESLPDVWTTDIGKDD